MFDWRDLGVFAALADEGSLAGAARRLGLNHATVSRRVAALEKALGIRLVTRLARSTPLTDKGRDVLKIAREMAEGANGIMRLAHDASATLSGHVTLTAPPAMATSLILAKLPLLMARHPDLRLTVSSEAAMVSLDRGDADLAIRLIRPDGAKHVIRRLGVADYALYGAPEWATLPPEQWRFICFDDRLSHVPQQLWLNDYIGERRVLLRTSDLYGQAAAACAGLGVALLPTMMGRTYPGLIRVAPEAPPSRQAWLVIHSDLRTAPAVRAVADFLVEVGNAG